MNNQKNYSKRVLEVLKKIENAETELREKARNNIINELPDDDKLRIDFGSHHLSLLRDAIKTWFYIQATEQNINARLELILDAPAGWDKSNPYKPIIQKLKDNGLGSVEAKTLIDNAIKKMDKEKVAKVVGQVINIIQKNSSKHQKFVARDAARKGFSEADKAIVEQMNSLLATEVKKLQNNQPDSVSSIKNNNNTKYLLLGGLGLIASILGIRKLMSRKN